MDNFTRGAIVGYISAPIILLAVLFLLKAIGVLPYR